MRKAVSLLQRFGLFVPKVTDDSGKDDMFILRLQRLRRAQSRQSGPVVFKNRRLPLEA